MFNRFKTKISDKITLHFLSIDDYSPRLKKHIEESIHFIWNGDNEVIEDPTDISITKLEILKLLEGKSAEQKIGIVSEFICHLYLRANKFKQHFLFRNLEEKGMKKGFDGVYLIDDDYYVYESKSSLETTITSTHNGNVSEAYRDLKGKIEGDNTANDPWRNAYNHSNMRTIDFNQTISQILKNLSKDYVSGTYSQIKDYNIIPSSTIYLGTRYSDIEKTTLKSNLAKLLGKYNFKSINAICINKKSIENFIDYLNE
ncbi:hypothetical protein NAL32_08380 [Chryseobacterium sp. Ch-15]|uniref:DUF1837 domain-containing protein n=1 Tax=Chryseobacterium muglaense TaxID=2893752 RepID=A0A9Q3UWW0_9FLAO|nr:hypothetical protein [Chryseobacterium muglaense]MBD3903030.1 hypothetical protein [Chryseobacterium muglaense]MCC9035862.1 hypothetical protein [Chryseobacterium muglaense]MCM2554409.1 hypothetical protein [Chryseobacterium muglaense]